MNFPVNQNMSYLVIFLIAAKLLISIFYFIPQIIFEGLVLLVFQAFSVFSTAYLLLYIKNFANQVMNSKELDYPLLAWVYLMTAYFIFDIFYFSGYESNYSGGIAGLLFLLVHFLLVWKIFRLKHHYYKKYFTLFALFLIAGKLVAVSLPLLITYSADAGLIEFDKSLFLMRIFIDAFNFSPFLILFFMIADFEKIFRASEIDPVRE